jgi:hypothetical protein
VDRHRLKQQRQVFVTEAYDHPDYYSYYYERLWLYSLRRPYNANDTRPEIIPREDFHVDNGHENTPDKQSGLLLLRKTECLQHLGNSYVCQTSGIKKLSQDNWKWALTKDAGTTKITTTRTNSLRTGGFADIRAYNLNKDIFVGLERSLPPFGEVKLEGLPFDADVLNRWLEHNKKGSSQHGGAGPRTRETLLDILRQVKRRVDSALQGSKNEAFGVRAEDRMNIELYDLLQEPDSSWLQDITAEGIQDQHLPFWILPADHVEAFWRSEIDRWLFGFERQVATVNSKNHQISVHLQFINSATASMFLRTLQNVTSKGNSNRPLQLWRSEYEIKDRQSQAQKGKRPKKIKRYGLGFEDSHKERGMPFVNIDLLSWEVLAIQPTKLTKTAFFNSFGFELGFKRKLGETGSEALKASQLLDQEEQWQACLRQYLEGLKPLHDIPRFVRRIEYGTRRVQETTMALKTAETNREPEKQLVWLRSEKKRIADNLEWARGVLADEFRESLRKPTELAIQAYIQDVFKTLSGVDSWRLPVPGVRKLPKEVTDGRRGLTWFTFVQAFSQPKNLSVEPSLAQPKAYAPNQQQSTNGSNSTFAHLYSHDWKGKMDGLFRVHDNITRHGWENKPYRQKIRRIYTMIKEALHDDVAKFWEAELGEAACRYIWAVPSFDSSNFSVLEKPSKNHTAEQQAAIKRRSVARRTKLLVPQMHTNRSPKLAKAEIEDINLLRDLTMLIPRVMKRLPNAGLDDETIMNLIGQVRLGLEESEKTDMVERLKALLAKPHQYMELMKPGAELPRATMWGNERKYADPGEEQEDRLPVTLGFTAGVPLLPIFNDLMQQT